MDYARVPPPANGTSGKQPSHLDSPEQLLDVFKAAALSVTKLYKTSAAAESRSRAEGYQECLESLLIFLDRENLGLRDGEGWKVRAWATEHLNGRDATPHVTTESEDEVDRTDRPNSPEVTRTSTEPQTSPQRPAESPNFLAVTVPSEPPLIMAPSQDTFTFQSSHPYPNLATLDLSDSRHEGQPLQPSRSSKGRHGGAKSNARTSGHLGRGAGAKRRWDFDDFFGGCLNGKDPFGNGGKRSRHT